METIGTTVAPKCKRCGKPFSPRQTVIGMTTCCEACQVTNLLAGLGLSRDHPHPTSQAYATSMTKNTKKQTGRMLDNLIEVQRILTKNKDHTNLALLHPLTDSLQDEYLKHLKQEQSADELLPPT